MPQDIVEADQLLPQERIHERIAEEIVDYFAPRIMGEIVGCTDRVQKCMEEQIVNGPVEVTKLSPQDPESDRIAQEIADLLAPRIEDEIADAAPSFSQQRVTQLHDGADCVCARSRDLRGNGGGDSADLPCHESRNQSRRLCRAFSAFWQRPQLTNRHISGKTLDLHGPERARRHS